MRESGHINNDIKTPQSVFSTETTEATETAEKNISKITDEKDGKEK